MYVYSILIVLLTWRSRDIFWGICVLGFSKGSFWRKQEQAFITTIKFYECFLLLKYCCYNGMKKNEQALNGQDGYNFYTLKWGSR